jgi:hypothetical protein
MSAFYICDIQLDMEKASVNILRWLLYMLAVMLLNACADNVISIESEDSVTFTTLETSFPVNSQETLKLRLRGSRTSGDYTQSVPDGKMILIEDVQIRGPTEVNGTTDLTYASVSIGSDDIFNTPATESKWRGLAFVGVAQTNMDLTLIHEGTTYKSNDRTTELYMQLGADYEIAPSLYGGGTWAFSLGPDLTGISEIDLKLNYALFKHLEVMGGYRWLKYNYYVEEDESIIHVNFKGPFIGINVPF